MSEKKYCVLKRRSTHKYSFHEAGAIWEVVVSQTLKLSEEDRVGTAKNHPAATDRDWYYSRTDYYGPMELDKALQLSKSIRGVS